MTNRTDLYEASFATAAHADEIGDAGYRDGLNGEAFNAPTSPAGAYDLYAEAFEEGEAEREAHAPASGPAPSADFPILARQEAIEEDAAIVYAHIRASGVTFDLSAKMEQAEAYSLRAGGSSLAIPSKLTGVRSLASRIERLADYMEETGAAFVPCVLHATTEGQRPGVAVFAAPEGRQGCYVIGHIQDKHAGWLLPLLSASAAGTVTDTTPVRVHVTAVTGGEAERPTRGVNIAISGLSAAIVNAHADRDADEAALEAAYESGDLAAIEAAGA